MSARSFGVPKCSAPRAVVAPTRHAAPETGALAKSASGALERQPYLRVGNLGDALERAKGLGYAVVGLAGEADETLTHAAASLVDVPTMLVMGAEGPGLRDRTRSLCDRIVRVEAAGAFGSLNVSNAAAVTLHAFRTAADSE